MSRPTFMPVHFETIRAAKERRRTLATVLNNQRTPVACQLGEILAACRTGNRCRLACCPSCLRIERRKFIRAATRVMTDHSTGWIAVTIIPAEPTFRRGHLDAFDLSAFVRTTARRLQRCGDAVPLVIGAVDLSLDFRPDDIPLWRPHLHLLVTGPNPTTARDCVLAAIPRASDVPRPTYARPVWSAPGAISYLVKPFASRRNEYVVNGKRRVRSQRLDGRDTAEYALHVARSPIGERVILKGLHRGGRRWRVM